QSIQQQRQRVRPGSPLEAVARGLGQSHRGFSLKLSFDDNGGQRLGHDRICDEPSTARAFNGASLQRREQSRWFHL
ncbi:hypothetical protein VIGAN_UM124600, partial [Vigna angularis var. angularis]